MNMKPELIKQMSHVSLGSYKYQNEVIDRHGLKI